MGKKTLTMSYDDYQMISVENEMYKAQYEKLKDEKKVYLTTINQGSSHSHWSHHEISGQIVEKDALLKKMKEHLEASKTRMKDREAKYKERIKKLEEELDQASIKTTTTRWWHKIFK